MAQNRGSAALKRLKAIRRAIDSGLAIADADEHFVLAAKLAECGELVDASLDQISP